MKGITSFKEIYSIAVFGDRQIGANAAWTPGMPEIDVIFLSDVEPKLISSLISLQTRRSPEASSLSVSSLGVLT